MKLISSNLFKTVIAAAIIGLSFQAHASIIETEYSSSSDYLYSSGSTSKNQSILSSTSKGSPLVSTFASLTQPVSTILDITFSYEIQSVHQASVFNVSGGRKLSTINYEARIFSHLGFYNLSTNDSYWVDHYATDVSAQCTTVLVAYQNGECSNSNSISDQGTRNANNVKLEGNALDWFLAGDLGILLNAGSTGGSGSVTDWNYLYRYGGDWSSQIKHDFSIVVTSEVKNSGATIPEPSVLAILGLGFVGLSLSRRKMK